MPAASVFGVTISPALARACREYLQGVASAKAWKQLPPLAAAAQTHSVPLSLAASIALGTSCVLCEYPIEGSMQETHSGWMHEGCAREGCAQTSLFSLMRREEGDDEEQLDPVV